MFCDKLKKYINRNLPDILSGNNFIAVVDTETTGFSKVNHDLISLSCEIRNHNWELQDETTLYASPSFKKRWTEQAEKIHKISYQEACSFDHPRKTAINFLRFLKPFKTDQNKPLLLISHDNNGFDFGFIEWLFRYQDLQYSFWKVFNSDYRISTVGLAREQGHKDNKLDEWAKRLNFKLNHHEVESDRIACAKIFEYLIRNNDGLGIS